MIRSLALAAAALFAAACSTAPPPAPAPSESSQAGWEAGQAAWLAWNSSQRGWSTTDSGLQYRRVSEARPLGARPGPTDTVRVHYEGTFIDGRVFDSSYESGEPIEFPLNRVIRGWTEGLQLMREGETFEFAIPADLAYGDRWVGGDLIPPGSVLLFQVELLAVTPAA
ncbi:FKBP-type peptidyl-prolyl cis-trans isomerase [Brevundimonas sp.]|uniref:FKBP-type peptidyl-prolyl cis-trans isomerase n=1 Tax=Brevundimonas sp. TaxID=1871086 RepID=UPI0025EA3678|nr:FKBP-type peptidyl-prolyl cis-trans isomerase [Brevundimonas sp.]